MHAVALRPQRASERVAVRLAVTATSDHNFFMGFTENVSEGGIFVATDSPLPVGTTFELRIDVPELSHSLAVQGEVRWLREPTDLDLPRGMGIQFVDIDEHDANVLQRYVNQVRESLFYDQD